MKENQLLRTVVRNRYMVSTVLLKYALTHSVSEYETMVFHYDAEADKVTNWQELDSARCDTEAGAVLDHFELVMKWSAPE